MPSKVIVATLVFLCVGVSALAADLAEQIRAAEAAGDYQRAATLYRQLIAEGTDSPEIRSNLGVMLHLAGNNRQAIEQFRIALRQKPALAGANLFGGLTEVDLGQPGEALPLLEKARQLDPTSPAPLLALGKAYVALRDYARARDNYARAAQLNPKLAEAWFGVGITDRSLAEQRLNKVARGGPSANAEALRKDAKTLLAGALEAFARAVELDSSSVRSHLILAESLAESGNLADAIPQYQAAMKLDANSEAASLGLATAYWKQRQFADARPLLKRVLVKLPNDPEANAIMADILEHDGDPVAAARHARVALAGNPNLLQAHVVLGRVYLGEGKAAQAISELEKVAAADPDGTYHFLLFRAYKQTGNDAAASAARAEYERLRQRGNQP